MLMLAMNVWHGAPLYGSFLIFFTIPKLWLPFTITTVSSMLFLLIARL